MRIFVTLHKNPCSNKKYPLCRVTKIRIDTVPHNYILDWIEVVRLATPCQSETCSYKSVLDQKLALVRSRGLHEVAAPIFNIFKINHMKNCTNQF